MVGLNDDDNSKRLSYLVRVPLLVYTDADTGVAMIKMYEDCQTRWQW